MVGREAVKGRKPKAAGRAFAEGDTRHLGANKLAARLRSLPKAMRGLPDPPDHMPELGKEQYRIWKEDLELMGMDFRADATLLEGAATNYALAVQALETIAKVGPQVREPVVDKMTGDVIAWRIKNHPATVVHNNAWSHVKAFCSELGLSLVSRQRLSIDAGGTPQGATSGVAVDPLIEALTRPRSEGADVQVPKPKVQ